MGDGPVRIQRKRTKGWKMPKNAVDVTRSGKFGNPFRIGGFFMMGDPFRDYGPFCMTYCEAAPEYADARFTQIKTNAEAVEWYRLYRKISPLPQDMIAKLRGKNLACWCPLDQPCHADVLLELANTP
jgi:hypothetical protein